MPAAPAPGYRSSPSSPPHWRSPYRPVVGGECPHDVISDTGHGIFVRVVRQAAEPGNRADGEDRAIVGRLEEDHVATHGRVLRTALVGVGSGDLLDSPEVCVGEARCGSDDERVRRGAET